MGKTANKQMICEVLMEAAKEDKESFCETINNPEFKLIMQLIRTKGM